MSDLPLEIGSAVSETPSEEIEKATKRDPDQLQLELGGTYQCCGSRCSCK